MLSKKDYVEVAKILNRATNRANKFSEDAQVEVNYITHDLTRYFKQDNPAFDVDKFNKAIYGEKQ